ncbi:hypothetical protein LOTGIDRAFT_237106 [Lottia gigantea]|uniref:EF-hand domain-containing protein n=1 Tax=Lottia gigantea TaxID=225164 RepID=V3ZIP7_LOTGI|nr:hypothetical protein LOTGIDRAFT_237106 [Lottia gigantea]ESO82205.1 hypothetical protein LOTGIDRAFT_237106 [Lottia gigantea]
MGLTPKQKADYEMFFKKADADNSGSLTIHELRNMLNKTLKLKVSDQDVIKMFQGVDKDGDQKVSLEEFLTEMAKIPEQDLQRSDFERAFEAIDTDGSRTLDSKEIQKVFESCGHKVNETQVKQIIQKLDKDGDGKINIDEFLKMFGH